ncbi:MAG: hypothetical protein ACFFD2_00365 [Promethearchaeota archaeon]
MEIPTRNQMLRYFFRDPKKNIFIKDINQVSIKYYYFTEPIIISTDKNKVCNFCLLKGISKLRRREEEFQLNQFDMVFLPENEQITIEPSISQRLENKICIVTSPILGDVGIQLGSKFEIQHFLPKKFIPRGELGDNKKMATYREVWTSIKNGYFLSGFTNIPQVSLAQGVVTSVNLEKEDGNVKILSHIHPNYPEVYIYCIDDTTESIAVTQYLINTKGQSVSRDLTDGEGVFFDGSLGHINFTKPTYKIIKYCQYMWIIPTFGKTQDVLPITLTSKLDKPSRQPT